MSNNNEYAAQIFIHNGDLLTQDEANELIDSSLGLEASGDIMRDLELLSTLDGVTKGVE